MSFEKIYIFLLCEWASKVGPGLNFESASGLSNRRVVESRGPAGVLYKYYWSCLRIFFSGKSGA